MRILSGIFHVSFHSLLTIHFWPDVPRLSCYDADMRILKRDPRGLGPDRFEDGFGTIELLISLVLIAAAAYFMMNRRLAGGHANAESSAIESAQKRLDAQGVQTVNAPVQAQVESISANHEKAVDCASSESAACRVDSSETNSPQKR